jgi:hypothetical protein
MKHLAVFIAALLLIPILGTSCCPSLTRSHLSPALSTLANIEICSELLGKNNKEVQAKLDAAWEHLFYGDDNTHWLC